MSKLKIVLKLFFVKLNGKNFPLFLIVVTFRINRRRGLKKKGKEKDEKKEKKGEQRKALVWIVVI